MFKFIPTDRPPVRREDGRVAVVSTWLSGWPEDTGLIEMDAQGTPKRMRFRGLRRLLKALLILAISVVLIAVVGVVVVWGHYWDFRVGDPTADTCASCHVLDRYSASLSDPVMLASNHAREDLTCVDCHERTLEQQVQETIAYVTNDYPATFPRAQVKMDTCFTCHEHGSYDQLAWRTTDLGVTDGQAKGHPANPHQPPHYTELECSSCHRMHTESVLLCSECHTYVFSMPMATQAAPVP